ncbi:head-tail connector protein [Rhodopseudomonas palustris]|uniref:head-tail connector protein n=1 Tax=Rhodopseudomonas palustris TaxID=1076 RepID=UPI002ACDC78A|nr:head-tail connector protein [Rhodopseudomonas palustris]WQH00165.1 head-tail connector protein [Rhodopseudomonas palustris]
MSAILLAGPVVEPWTLAELKAFLRLDHDDDDSVIASLQAAARAQIEAMTRRALLLQSWRITRDAWPRDGRIALRIGPLRALLAARVLDAQGTAHPIDVENFVVDTSDGVIAAPVWSLREPGRSAGGIVLDVELGYGTHASDVPELLRHAVRTLAAHWYDNRGMAAIGGSVAMLPGSVAAMIASFRVPAL